MNKIKMGVIGCLHQTGIGVFTFAGNAQLASLGEVTAEIDAYVWYARGIGSIAMVDRDEADFRQRHHPADYDHPNRPPHRNIQPGHCDSRRGLGSTQAKICRIEGAS